MSQSAQGRAAWTQPRKRAAAGGRAPVALVRTRSMARARREEQIPAFGVLPARTSMTVGACHALFTTDQTLLFDAAHRADFRGVGRPGADRGLRHVWPLGDVSRDQRLRDPADRLSGAHGRAPVSRRLNSRSAAPDVCVATMPVVWLGCRQRQPLWRGG